MRVFEDGDLLSGLEGIEAELEVRPPAPPPPKVGDVLRYDEVADATRLAMDVGIAVVEELAEETAVVPVTLRNSVRLRMTLSIDL